MTTADLLTWFNDLALRRASVPKRMSRGVAWAYERTSASAWLNEAESAMAALLPASHPTRQQFSHILKSTPLPAHNDFHIFDIAAGAFDAAHRLLRDGRLTTLADGIRADTVADVLTMADTLLGGNHVIAATVLAGGALETHLAHIIGRHALTITGDGSIGKYNSAVGQARNNGTTIYSANDGKLVDVWGGMRNEAAHDPTTFKRSSQEVQRMIDGIREFMARNP